MLNNFHVIVIYAIATLQNKVCNCMLNNFTK